MIYSTLAGKMGEGSGCGSSPLFAAIKSVSNRLETGGAYLVDPGSRHLYQPYQLPTWKPPGYQHPSQEATMTSQASQLSTVYSVTEVAARIGVGGSTVRRYSEKYAAQLSPGASARPRYFTDADILKLAEATKLGSQLVEGQVIIDRLQAIHIGDVVVEATNVADEATSPVQTPTVAPDAPQLPSVAIDVLIARMTALERAQQGDRRLTFVAGAGALALVEVLAALLVLLAR
jgi:DNA-binding transcriptional MerR regulator